MAWRDITVHGLLNSVLGYWNCHELSLVADRLRVLSCNTVQSGPFAGMCFESRSSKPAIIQKLIGSYECELHKIVDELIKHNFTTIINIGAADGYYAVGMAIKCPQAQVVAYEMEDSLRLECAKNARMNKVGDRVRILGACDFRSLNSMQLEGTLIIMDCEGAELYILSEDIKPQLMKTWLLIELHDALMPGCSRILKQRFDKTHYMEFISALSRNPKDFIVLDGFNSRQKFLALDESRLGVQEWVLMFPK